MVPSPQQTPKPSKQRNRRGAHAHTIAAVIGDESLSRKTESDSLRCTAPRNTMHPQETNRCIPHTKPAWHLGTALLLWLALISCLLAMSPSLASAATPSLADGTYEVAVTLEGGTGRASVQSPAPLTVHDGTATATIIWSSPHYDYMVVEGTRYLPVNDGGNSTFEIPVLTFDEPFEVIADTTAMSTPHEISYELTFDSSSVQAQMPDVTLLALGSLLVAALAAYVAVRMRTRRR